MVIKRIGPLSCAKIAGVLYAIIGVLIGAFVSLISAAGAFIGSAENSPFPRFLGAAAIIVFPIFYGVMGFVTTLIAAWLYNVLAGWVGGVELEVQ